MKDAVDLLNEKIEAQAAEIERLRQDQKDCDIIIEAYKREVRVLNEQLAEGIYRLKEMRGLLLDRAGEACFDRWFNEDGEPL